MIVRSRIVGPFAENTYLVGCDEEGVAALVDPGGDLDDLLATAARLGLAVEAIWLTHAHVDHLLGVADAVRRTGAPILLHPDDEIIYRAAPEQARAFGVEIDELPPPDRPLRDQEELAVGALTCRVLHVPGHSPGHVAFSFPTEGAVFSGDCLFAGSIGRTDLPGGDHATLLSSIRDRLLRLGDDVRVYPGHGPATTVGRERRENPFLAGGGRAS